MFVCLFIVSALAYMYVLYGGPFVLYLSHVGILVRFYVSFLYLHEEIILANRAVGSGRS